MSVYNKSDIDYQKLISLLKNGGVFCYPTETLYGLGCLANNEEAIEKIYKIKQRDKEKNFTLIFLLVSIFIFPIGIPDLKIPPEPDV